ncbi:MAG: ABC transporter substrate-binding protein [Kyrpidia tusciae]|nr:ABC transporter substrate-binding protein [Kyrpidia tusciae]MBE3551784.1 ABC transporter substrate-binding protein [Kyrpidia tusciae]
MVRTDGKRKLWTVFILFAAILVLSSCGTGAAPSASPQGGASPPAVTHYPLTIKDDSGTSVTIAREPRRIVSLIPSHTEILFALGLEGRVAGVTTWDNYPPGVQKKVEAVLDGLNPPIERLVALHPDLVVLGSHNESSVQAVRNAGLTAVVYDPQSLEAVYGTIEALGEITNRTPQAAALVNQMKAKASAIAAKVSQIPPDKRVRVYVEADPNQLYTAGNHTFMDELIRLAGGINVASDLNGWKPMNAEVLIQKNPQVIVVTYGYYVPDAVDKPKQRPGWQGVDAVRNNRVYSVDSDLVSRPGPRIVDGAETLAKLFYPQLFQP